VTVREGWPSFGQWQQNLELRRRTKQFGMAFVEITADFSGFAKVIASTEASFKRFAEGMVQAFKPKLGRWHKLGFHNKCSPIICKKAAKLCNQAESDLRMEEYLQAQENGRYYTEYDAGIKLDPYLRDSQEYWDS